MKINPARSFATVLGLAALVSGNAFAANSVILLDDTFADGNRTTQSLTNSAAWYGSTGALALTTVEASSGNWALQLSSDNVSARAATAYFTNSPNDQISLSTLGDKLTATFNLKITSDPSIFQWFRIGLTETGNTRYTADNNASMSLVGGYRTDIGTNNGSITVQDRTTPNTVGSITSGSGWTSNASSSLPSGTLNFVQNTNYTITYEIERVANDGLAFTYTITDGTHSVEKTITLAASSGLSYDFDTFSICWGSKNTTITTGLIDNVVITYSTIPEPASAAALVGALVLLGALRRARRR